MSVLPLMLALALLVGCQVFDTSVAHDANSPLQTARPSPTSVALEIFFVRYPYGDPALTEHIWSEVDESAIPPEVRRELAANGIRAGVVGRMVPDAIAEALEISADVDEAADAAPPTIDKLVDWTVQRSFLQIKPGTRRERAASDNLAELVLMERSGGELVGRRFRDAQAIYSLQVESESDQSMRLIVTPEIQYGQPRQRYVHFEGGYQFKTARDSEVYNRLKIEVPLAPGEMLLVTGLPGATASLGQVFHATSQADQQKLMVIRLAQVPDSSLFAADFSPSDRWWK